MVLKATVKLSQDQGLLLALADLELLVHNNLRVGAVERSLRALAVKSHCPLA